MRPTVSVKPCSVEQLLGASIGQHTTTTLAMLEAQGQAENTLKAHTSETQSSSGTSSTERKKQHKFGSHLSYRGHKRIATSTPTKRTGKFIH